MCKQVKWYFNVSRWKPTKDEWSSLMACVADEEVTRINKFVYQDNAKSALIGRALIRKFVSQAIGRSSNEVSLIRTDLGRPVVCDLYKKSLGHCWPQSFDFNISHDGDFCALTGFYSTLATAVESVGVDVTKIVRKDSRQELDRFLDLMSRREFTQREWETVDRVSSDRQKCFNFTRLWCLKECFIKSIGLGLKFKLTRVEFLPSNLRRYNLSVDDLKGVIIDDTSALLDGEPARNWRFLETSLGDDHLVAIGYKFKTNAASSQEIISKSPFVEIDVSDLTKSLTYIREPCDDNWTKFAAKESRRR